jgi:hypothetical protein
MLEVHNEIYRLDKIQERLNRGKRPLQADDLERLGRLPAWKRVRDDQESLARSVWALEDEALLGLYGGQPLDAAVIAEELESCRRQWESLLLALYLLRFDRPDDVTVAVFSEQPEHLVELTEAYDASARAGGGATELWQFLPNRSGRKDDAGTERRLVPGGVSELGGAGIRVRWWDRERKALRLEESSEHSLRGVIGCALAIHAPAALPRFTPEAGLHLFHSARQSGRCLVDTSPLPIPSYEPPAGIERRGTIGSQPKQRTYQLDKHVAEDVQLPRKLSWQGEPFRAVLAEALEQRLRLHTREVLDP